MAVDVSIPNRARFKPSEVCQIAGVKPYVLRSWEAEFPALGGETKTKNGTRVYRRADVELVLRIKALVFGEGLTLGAARRRLDELEGDAAPVANTVATTGGAVESEARARIDQVKSGLRAILAMLANEGGADDPHTTSASDGLDLRPVHAAHDGTLVDGEGDRAGDDAPSSPASDDPAATGPTEEDSS